MEYNQEKDKWSIKMLRNNKNQAYKNYKKYGVLDLILLQHIIQL